MTTNYPGDPDNYPANVREPDDGDLSNATALAAAVEDLADRTAYVQDKKAAKIYSPQGATQNIWLPMCAAECLATDGTDPIDPGWLLGNSADNAGAMLWYQMTNDPDDGQLVFDLPMPYPCALLGLIVFLAGGTELIGVPEYKYLIDVCSLKIDGSSMTNTVLSSTEDPETVLADYAELHAVTITSTGLVVPASVGTILTTRYYIRITGHNGTNAIPGGFVAGVLAQIGPIPA